MPYAGELDPATVAFIEAMPKAELHVHLEGTIRPSTLLQLARRHNIDLPARDEEGLRRFYTFRDFAHFVEVWITINQALRRGEDFELITRELGAEAARQNIRYLEVTFTPYTHVGRKGIPWDELSGGVAAGAEIARREWGVQMRFITDIARECYSQGEMEVAQRTVEWAVEGKTIGVVALGLGGMEVGNPAEAFADVFDLARRNGLHSIPHAGETTGPESVWAALRALGAERIGHGIGSAGDPELVKHLRERQIPLEVCPTSNVCTRAVPSLEAHPVRRLYDAGVYITVNTDDPAVFNTTLNDEYMLAAARFGFTTDELVELSLGAVRASCLPAEDKEMLAGEFQAEVDRLRRAV